MNFRNVPPEIQQGIRELVTDEEFQKRFRTDQKLDEIDEMKQNLASEYKSLMLIFNNEIIIDNKSYKSLTAGIWAFLWAIDSPIINYNKEIRPLDCDIFFYILEHGVRKFNASEIVSNAINYTSNVLNLTFDEALNIILTIIKVSFRALNLFPKVKAQGRSSFDAEWLTSLVTKVHVVTGYTPEYIINDLALSTACYYFAQYIRMNGNEQIYKRTDEEILKLEDHRASELVVERLIEKGYIKEEDKNKWVEIITTPPNKK